MVMLEGAKILFLAPKHIHHRGVGSGGETDFLFDQIWWQQGKFDEEKPTKFVFCWVPLIYYPSTDLIKPGTF